MLPGLKAQDAQVLFKLVPEGCASEGSCCHSRHVNLCGLGVRKPKFVRKCEKATCHDVIAVETPDPEHERVQGIWVQCLCEATY